MDQEICYRCRREIKGEKTEIVSKNGSLYMCSQCKKSKEYWENIYNKEINKYSTCRIYFEEQM